MMVHHNTVVQHHSQVYSMVPYRTGGMVVPAGTYSYCMRSIMQDCEIGTAAAD